MMRKRLGAEFLGTFWLVMGGCSNAVLAANFSLIGIGLLGVALAFGLTVPAMAFGTFHWPYLGLPFEPGGHDWAGGGRAFSGERDAALYDDSSHRCLASRSRIGLHFERQSA